MALEDTMERLIDALTQNTAAHGGKAPAAAVRPAAPKKTAAITLEMVRAALVTVKDAHGTPAAKKIINGAGKAKELNAIKPAQFAEVIAACDEIMGEGDTSEDAATEDDEL